MKHLKLLIIVLTLTLTISNTGLAQKIKNVDSPKLMVVKFHADWCKSCRLMGPVFEDLQDKIDGSAVLFVKLDFTNNQTKHQAKMLGTGLGIGAVLKKNQRRTGFILIIDATTKKVLKKLTKDDDIYAMETQIKAFL